ncbi:unnamed protein product [Lymnaea stagnalis]|uniref:non-specific serine/threonine protein kinase n=1 Tax=Lymnaea stagnalis TaxID=6523 RepID=A0AAV2HGY3_LYMST
MSYQILSILGQGSFGYVYHLKLPNSKEYALKVTDITHVPAIIAITEPETMLQLQHPHIIQLCYVNCDQIGQRRCLYMLMEYCERGTLTKAIANGVSEDQAITWFIQMADALTYLHSKKVMHRDIKPDNILLNSNNDIKVGDLGTARIQEFTAQGGATAVGTYCYMSPQILQGQPYKDKTDVWSLGCVFHQVLSKNPPFKFFFWMGKQTVNFQIPPMPSSYSQGLRNLILTVLDMEESTRPSAEKILGDLVRLQNRPYNRQQYVRLPMEVVDHESLLNCLKNQIILRSLIQIVSALAAHPGGY